MMRSVLSSFTRTFVLLPVLLACGSRDVAPDGGMFSDAELTLDAAQDTTSDAQTTCSSGGLDPSFGDDGIVRVFGLDGHSPIIATGVAIDAQSRIVVSGGFISGARSCVLARFLPTGDPDPSFGSNGIVRQSADQNVCWFNTIALQEDGGIVAIGAFDAHTHSRALLARFFADGQLDTSFGTGGIVVLEPTAVTSGHAVAITPDNNIVVGGMLVSEPTSSFLVRQYTSGGMLDSAFGSGGNAETAFVGGNDAAAGVVVRADGKIVVVGKAGTASSTDFAVVRYQADGTLDSTFGSAGIVTVPLDTYSQGIGIALDSSANSVVVGSSTTEAPLQRGAALRLTSDGLLDASFGVDGTLIEPGKPELSFLSVATQGDDGIVAVGITTKDLGSLALARYTANGVLDPSFGTDGFAENPSPTWWNQGIDVAVQADGRIVAVGGYGDLSRFDMLVARYCP